MTVKIQKFKNINFLSKTSLYVLLKSEKWLVTSLCDEIAQMVERWTVELEVPGSNPATSQFFHAMLQRVTRKRYIWCILLQGFRVSCLFTGQYNTKGYDTIIDVI